MKLKIKNRIIIWLTLKNIFIEFTKTKKLKDSKIKILILEFSLLERFTYSTVHTDRTTRTKNGNIASKYIEDNIMGIPMRLIKDLLLLVLLVIYLLNIP